MLRNSYSKSNIGNEHFFSLIHRNQCGLHAASNNDRQV